MLERIVRITHSTTGRPSPHVTTQRVSSHCFNQPVRSVHLAPPDGCAAVDTLGCQPADTNLLPLTNRWTASVIPPVEGCGPGRHS